MCAEWHVSVFGGLILVWAMPDGTFSYVLKDSNCPLKYCPWCGAKLPDEDHQ